MVNIKDLVVGGNARTFNTATGHDISGKPTGQGYGAARKGPAVNVGKEYKKTEKK